MSECREFKQEPKSSLLDVDVLLQRAKSLAALPSEPIVRTREIPHITLDAIIRAIEQLSNRLGEYEILQQNGRNLHLQMETVQTKMERIIDQLEATLGCGSERLSQVQKAPHQDLSTLSNNGRADKGRLSVGEYLSQGRLLLESNQYEACLELMTLALTEHPGTEAIHDIARECRRRLADQQLQEEMFVYLENVKKEAIDQFDREQFQECVKTFAFLSELEPDNRVLKEYLKLSQQQVGETQGVALPNEVSAVQLTAMNTVPFREGIVSSAFSAALSSEVSIGRGPSNRRRECRRPRQGYLPSEISRGNGL